MESKSDISSYSSHNFDPNKIPSIHVQQFMLDEHAKNLSSINGSRTKQHPHIFTVAETLKDPFILKHIKPDYGSLGDFIGDSIINRDLLHQKKRKNEINDDDNQENNIKLLLQKNNQQQLNKIYLNNSTSPLQKKIAGKLMVQNLFEEAFGVTLNSFKTLNVKQQPVKNCKINLDNIDQIFMGKKQPSAIIQLNNEKKLTKISRNSNQEQKSSKIKKKQSLNLTYKQRIQIIQQIKSRYLSLRRLQIRKQCSEYKKLLPKVEIQPQEMYYQREQQKKQIQKPVHIMQITQKKLHLQKLTMKPQLMLFILSQFQLFKIQTIILNQIRVTQELLCFMIDVVKNFCVKLQIIQLACISLQKTQNLANKIKQLLQVSYIRQLALEYMDIETKQFCVICLGLGSNKTIQFLNLQNNGIDERACKSLQLITKHCLNLRKISLKKNFLQPHHLSYFSVQCKSKINI